MTSASSPTQREQLLALFGQAVEGVAARTTLARCIPPPPRGRVLVIAIGKAAAEMMSVAAQHIRAPMSGLVVTRYGHLNEARPLPPHIEVIEAGHPAPDAASVRAADRALELVRTLSEDDQLLVLLSGGGSALCAAPAPGVTLADKQAITRALLASGATITEINCVRKHLSRIKGGRLAVAARRAQLRTLIISDVPGDDPSFVASGPTVADTTTLEQARAIIAKYRIEAPDTVRAALNDPANESPAPDSPELTGADVVIIARARDALDAAASRAHAWGYAITDLGDRLQGEARELGAAHAALARGLSGNGKAHAILSGGEATVTVSNPSGRGGRNLEYALALAIALDGAAGVCALACDTDGIDGTEDAAGAMVFPDTLARARRLGLDPHAHLRANQSYTFFERLGDLVITGPTRTNVNDFRVILTGAA